MTASTHGSIVPITLTVNGRIGLTLWAPPWEDEDGEEWQGFLGEGSAILLFPSQQALADYVAQGTENDLSDHPAWDVVERWALPQFRPGVDATFDLDAVFEWAAGEPDPVTVSSLAGVVEMVAEIGECCDDGALKALVGSTPEYLGLVDDEVSYQGKEGRREWNDLGAVVASTWERAIARVEKWLEWRGDFSSTDLSAETVWDRVGAEPIVLELGDGPVYTVRGSRGDDTDPLFLGSDGTISVFDTVAGLALFCREATSQELTLLELWDEVRDAGDELFTPALDAAYDLTTPTSRGAVLLRELLSFCEMSADTLTDPIDPADWAAAVADLQTCLQVED